MAREVRHSDVTGSYLIPPESLSSTLPSVLATAWQNYSDGSYEIQPDNLATSVAVLLAVDWAGQTKSTYDTGADSLLTHSVALVGSPTWVQYGIIQYGRFVNDKAATSVPVPSNLTWN